MWQRSRENQMNEGRLQRLRQWRLNRIRRRDVVCHECGNDFIAYRSDAEFCSPACKQSVYRRRVTDRTLVKGTEDKRDRR